MKVRLAPEAEADLQATLEASAARRRAVDAQVLEERRVGERKPASFGPFL